VHTKPLISIVTVCLNSVEHIERSILSVLNQTYSNIEYIIIDGGSTDGTLDIIRKNENRISRWVSEKDRGIYDAMNKGIAMCTGEFIGLLNSDDYYASDAVQSVVDSLMADDSIEVIHGNTIVTYHSGNVMLKGNHDDLLKNWTVHHNTCFIRSDIYKLYNYNIHFKISADYELILKLFYIGTRFKHIDHVLLYYYPFGASSKSSMVNRIDKFRIRAKYNVAVALKLFLREAFMHYDEQLYGFTVREQNKNNFSHVTFNRVKKLIRPLYLRIKKFVITN
jgi:glycosyltransferase involved in cell wall biosynthesis